MDQADREELRFALRRYLAARPTAACTLDMLRHALALKGYRATDDIVAEELAYWTGTDPAQVKEVRPEHGSQLGWQITSHGRLAESRGQ